MRKLVYLVDGVEYSTMKNAKAAEKQSGTKAKKQYIQTTGEKKEKISSDTYKKKLNYIREKAKKKMKINN